MGRAQKPTGQAGLQAKLYRKFACRTSNYKKAVYVRSG